MRKALVIVHTGLASSSRIKRRSFDQVEDLYLDGAKKNVEIRLENIEERIVANLSSIGRDLLELAAVLYVADTSIMRGDTDVYGQDWQRQIRVIMPVRHVRKWQRAAPLLSELLTYLSGDASITIEFRPHKLPKTGQQYLQFKPSSPGFQGANSIVLFSGGLDSLTGAAEAIAANETPLLVTHRSSPTRTELQRSLSERLSQEKHCRLPCIGVWVTRKGKEAADNNQRLRSFLYLSLGAVAGHELNIPRICYCENGITTFNLPLSEQRIGSRSTRTTHPRVISLFRVLIQQVMGFAISVENPSLLRTKRQVVEKLSQLGCADMIGQSLSCTRTFAVEKTKRHCGTCFQCITRRFAVVAADAEASDPVEDYAKDIFRSSLSKGVERGNAIDWVNFNLTVSALSLEGLLGRFPQLYDGLGDIFGNPHAAAHGIYAMYQKNADDVKGVLQAKTNQYYSEILSGQLAVDGLLRLVGSGAHLLPNVVRLMEEIEGKLLPGLREAFSKQQPTDERCLQDQAGIILKAADYNIEREAPEFAFSIVKTRPDYSFPESGLFLEMKLLKEGKHRVQVVDGILADIQKYQTKCQGMLFVIYQTAALITDHEAFARGICSDPTVHVRVLG
jgi:7-cyano-7-deazaguanine synthase in queuosine biosynthesis